MERRHGFNLNNFSLKTLKKVSSALIAWNKTSENMEKASETTKGKHRKQTKSKPHDSKQKLNDSDKKALFLQMQAKFATKSTPSIKKDLPSDVSPNDKPNDKSTDPTTDTTTDTTADQSDKQEDEIAVILKEDAQKLNAKVNMIHQELQKTSSAELTAKLDTHAAKLVSNLVKLDPTTKSTIQLTRNNIGNIYISLELLLKLGMDPKESVEAIKHTFGQPFQTTLDWICLHGKELPDVFKLQLANKPKARQTKDCTSSSESSSSSEEEEHIDSDDGLGFERLEIQAMENPGKNIMKKSVALSIPPSWTGKTPVNLLNTYYRSFSFDISHKFVLKVKEPSFSVIVDDIFIECPQSQKTSLAKMLVATRLLYERHPQAYSLLPPSFKDVWNMWSKQTELDELERLVLVRKERSLQIQEIAGDIRTSIPREIPSLTANYNDESPFPFTLVDLQCQYRKRTASKSFLDAARDRESLPMFNVRDEFTEIMNSEWDFLLVNAQTGSGKSTLLPHLLLNHVLSPTQTDPIGKIYITQPRRISTISISQRVSHLMGDSHHHPWVGYQIRGQDTTKPSTIVTFMTLGVLLAHLASSPDLNQVSHLILDEVHEDGIDLNVVLTHLYWMKKKRPDLRVILMSATMDEQLTGRFSQRYNVREWSVEGRMYPVQELYLEDAMTHVGLMKEIPNLSDKTIDYSLIASLILPQTGTSMVFLPGMAELRRCRDELNEKTKLPILLLHSSLVPSPLIFSPTPKIILATNIAETGITVPTLDFVVDSCLVKRLRFDDGTLMERLRLEWTSVASSTQRRGRGGRTKSGVCYHLISRELKRALVEEKAVMRESLVPSTLWILGMKYPSVQTFWHDHTLSKRISAAESVLERVGCIEKGELTALGTLCTRIPVSPQYAKMLLYSIVYQCLEPVVNVVSILTASLTTEIPVSCLVPDSDLLTLSNVYQMYEDKKHAEENVGKWCRSMDLDQTALESVSEVKRNLIRSLHPFLHNHKHPNRHHRFLLDYVFGIGLWPRVLQGGKEWTDPLHRAKVSAHASSMLKSDTSMGLIMYFEKRSKGDFATASLLHKIGSDVALLLDTVQPMHLQRVVSLKSCGISMNCVAHLALSMQNFGRVLDDNVLKHCMGDTSGTEALIQLLMKLGRS
jgi:hypothetical protein